MLSVYPVDVERELDRSNPLFVGNFFPLQGMWWRKRKQRQGLIISMALAWNRLVKKNQSNPGFIEEEILITHLTKQVKDARVILEHFFTVKRIGFNYGDSKKSPTIIAPKRLNKKTRDAIESIINEVHFEPGPAPKGSYTVSKVFVRKPNRSEIIAKLTELQRDDLIPPVSWLLDQTSPLDFYFEAAGSLKARDKSVWPIRSIELWPSWLRSELFGTVVDLENAYNQFIMSKLREKYKDNEKKLAMKYPDLLFAYTDKQQFRESLCTDFLRLPVDDDGIDVVKKLLMSLANGSNITPALIASGSSRSEAVRIVLENCPHLAPTELLAVGKRLSTIAKQFAAAKRDLCLYLLKERPTRKNQKQIFKLYFEWERQARYKIWNLANCTGLALHDGLDGILVDDPKNFAGEVLSKTGLVVSVTEVEDAH